MALEASENSGDYYPIWGTCLGFELIAQFTYEHDDVRTKCWSQDRALNLNFTQDFNQTRLVGEMPHKVLDILANENVTINFHRYCVAPETVATSRSMSDFWSVISTNHDDNGTEFVSLFESKDHPIWGSQFHPEKNPFEWAVKYDEIPHQQDAVDVAIYFANFFVQQCRRNAHSFDDRTEEEEYLIYNFVPTYTGKETNANYSMQQCYFF